MENLIFQVGGGIGKCIVATAVCKAFKKKYPEHNITVVTGWPEIFKRNPNVDKVYRFGETRYFYEENIMDKEPLLFSQEVYLSREHIVEKKPLRQSWIEMCGMDYEGEMPELFFNPVLEDDIRERYKREKPVLLMHTNGGPVPDREVASHYSWCRDLPKRFVRKIYGELSDRYHVLQVCNHQSQVIEGAEVVEGLNEIEIMLLLKCTSKRLLIDSCLQHGAATMNIESTVLWIGNDPDVWGYPIHDNMTPTADAKFKSPTTDLYSEYDINSPKDQYPYDTDMLFSVKEVLKSIETQYYADELSPTSVPYDNNSERDGSGSTDTIDV